jgi:DNA-binding NarL/FixJ family response regulator
VLHITPWDREALRLLARGTEVNQIARHLGLSAGELETNLAALFARMGAANQTEAVAAALKRGLLSLS